MLEIISNLVMVLGVFTFFIIAAAAMSELHSGCN